MTPCLIAFSACSLNLDIRTVKFDLNGGSFTQQYKADNDITSDNVLKAVNLNYYGGFSDGMPDERDLTAPANDKVFAGWYLDKECTPKNYLTAETWVDFAQGISDKTGDNVIYARWIEKGTKDILYEIVDDEVSFGTSFLTTNTAKGNMTDDKIVRFNVSVNDFSTQKTNLPDADDLIFNSVNYEFNGWKVVNNGHYYSFKDKDYDTKATNKMDYVNADFDSVNFSEFFAEDNENVAYVLLKPKALTTKPWNKITIALDNTVAGYDASTYSTQIANMIQAVGSFGCTPDPKDSKLVNIDEMTSVLYFVKLTLEIRYDMSFENINKILPTITMLDDTLTFDKWVFKIAADVTEYDLNETNWAKAQVRPDEYREIQLILKTKAK